MLKYIPLSYRAHQPVCVTNKLRNMKPTITTRQYSLGYKYNFEITYSRAEQPTNAFAKNGKMSISNNQM